MVQCAGRYRETQLCGFLYIENDRATLKKKKKKKKAVQKKKITVSGCE
jgi:hypothetical protein